MARPIDPSAPSGAFDPLLVALSGAAVGSIAVTPMEAGQAPSVRPSSVAELARVVSIARRVHARVAVTTRVSPGLVALDLTAFDRMDAPDDRCGVIRVGAGARVRAVEAKANEAGLTLGALLPSTGRKTVGAWLAGPTRGDRSVPPGRLETAALSLEAMLPDGSLYHSREVPRSAAGPDLDQLLLGGEGRFGVLTGATLRLMPRANAVATGAREAKGVLDAVEAARRAVQDGLNPAEVRWERARGTAEALFIGPGAAQRAHRFGTAAIGGREVRSHLELAGSWKAWAAASPLKPATVQWVALHVDGAFGALEFDDEAEAERAAGHARHIGLVVVSPRRLRAERGLGWAGAAGALHAAFAAEIDPNGTFAP